MTAPYLQYNEIDESQITIARGSIVAIAGSAAKGPIGTDVLLANVAQLRRTFGSSGSANTHEAVALAYFALQAGARVRFSRSVHLTDVTDLATRTSVAASVTIQDIDGTPEDTLTISGKTEGTWANNVGVTIANASSGVAEQFKLTIASPGLGIRAFVADNITIDDVANLTSDHWTFTDEGSASVAPNNRPANGSYTLVGGDDGTGAMTDATRLGASAVSTGIYGWSSVDFLDGFAPGVVDDAAQVAFVASGELRRFVAHLSIPKGLSPSSAVDFRNKTGTYAGDTKINSSFGVMHFGDITFVNPDSPSNAEVSYFNHGGFAGVLARNDTERSNTQRKPGPWATPAGARRGQVPGALTIHSDASVSGDADTLADNQLNWFVINNGIVQAENDATLLVTAVGVTSYLQQLHVRRTMLALQASLSPVLEQAKYEPIDTILFKSQFAALDAILRQYQRDGAFSDYRLDCDQDARTVDEAKLNTADTRNANVFLVDLRVQPFPNAKYIEINVAIDPQGVVYTET